MDISYVKKGADLNHANMVTPDFQQLYVGWTDDNEWTNYTVNVKEAGTYRIDALYSHKPQTVQFSLNEQPAAECKLPVDPSTQVDLTGKPDWMVWHVWNKAECGTITFQQAGLQLLTLHFNSGSNFAYFDFREGGSEAMTITFRGFVAGAAAGALLIGASATALRSQSAAPVERKVAITVDDVPGAIPYKRLRRGHAGAGEANQSRRREGIRTASRVGDRICERAQSASEG